MEYRGRRICFFNLFTAPIKRCTSTLSLSDVAALGAGDTPFTLRHSGSTATFTVGGADHSALLR